MNLENNLVNKNQYTNQKASIIDCALGNRLSTPANILPSNIKVNNLKMDNNIQPNNIKPNKKNKCWVIGCNRKLGIYGFECKCGVITCTAHRYPSEHSCSINYRKIAMDKLRKENPIVIADKFPDRID
jgi:hypothetical protein